MSEAIKSRELISGKRARRIPKGGEGEGGGREDLGGCGFGWRRARSGPASQLVALLPIKDEELRQLRVHRVRPQCRGEGGVRSSSLGEGRPGPGEGRSAESDRATPSRHTRHEGVPIHSAGRGSDIAAPRAACPSRMKGGSLPPPVRDLKASSPSRRDQNCHVHSCHFY